MAGPEAAPRSATREPTLLIVTDRRDLDEQIEGTFLNCGFPSPTRATSVRELRELLSSGRHHLKHGAEVSRGRRHRRARPTHRQSAHPVLSEASNVFVLTDEAHRTQYGSLAANLRAALPNAVFFGFTGTPIDKDDRSTLQTFGPYIDTRQYSIEMAVADGATVPIFYESRLPNLHIIGQTLDQIFDRVFADRSEAERRAIRPSTRPSRPSPKHRAASRRSAWT